jgi:hypothetical protein
MCVDASVTGARTGCVNALNALLRSPEPLRVRIPASQPRSKSRAFTICSTGHFALSNFHNVSVDPSSAWPKEHDRKAIRAPLGLTMVQEREFTVAEEAAVGGTTPVIIDVTLAEGLFANENPVGRLLQYGADSGTADSKPMVIVGLAPAVKHDLFKNRPEAHIYVPSGGRRFHPHVRLRARGRTADG